MECVLQLSEAGTVGVEQELQLDVGGRHRQVWIVGAAPSIGGRTQGTRFSVYGLLKERLKDWFRV